MEVSKRAGGGAFSVTDVLGFIKVRNMGFSYVVFFVDQQSLYG